MSKETKISLCALTLYPFDMVPGQRFRIEQWQPFLEEQGISIDYYSYADNNLTRIMPKPGNIFAKISGLTKGIFRRLSHLKVLSKYDAILIYRAAAIVGPAFFERLIKISGRPLIYDFDDAIFLKHTNEANRLFGWLKFAGKTGSICRLSDTVTVGNAWLAEYARQYNPNVTVIPSSVNTETYSPRPKTKRNSNKLIVGWTGSSTSQTHLEMFAPTLKRLLARRNVEIHVHSDRSPKLIDIPFVWHQWSPDNEVEVISNFDIGIMPLPEDEWSLGKCSMKALLYMSLGIPTVCSDVGMNREVIVQGKNGFLVSTEEEWLESLENLIDSEDLRFKLGNAARETVVEKYSMKKCALLFGKVIRDLTALPKHNDKN
jgi:glycosyltransferase involved in cell wall biosynthesis